DEFVRLGDRIRELELDITLGEPSSAARADYDRAVEAYDRANALNRQGATTAADQALDEGLTAIASARERLAGRRQRARDSWETAWAPFVGATTARRALTWWRCRWRTRDAARVTLSVLLAPDASGPASIWAIRSLPLLSVTLPSQPSGAAHVMPTV